jgi:histidinol-phosphate aminotransferase
MVKIKDHLEKLYRMSPEDKGSRAGCLRLDMNESVSGLPEDFARSVMGEVNTEFLAGYPEYSRLRSKIAAQDKLKPENICLSNGSDAAIKYIFDAYISPGDGVLLTDPTFAMYPVYCAMFNARPVTVEYNRDMTFPGESFTGKISSEIKMAVLVNPNNPTGALIGRDLLTHIIEKAAGERVLVIIDEAYFYFNGFSVIEKVNNYKNLIVLRTFSKFLGIASARLGYAAACCEIAEDLRKVKPTYDVNSLAVLLGEKILERPDIMQGMVADVKEGKDYLVRKLSAEGIEYRAGCANFVLIKCRNRAAEITEKLAERKILVGGGFKQDFLKDYIRITIGAEEIMEKFWDSFIKIWKS